MTELTRTHANTHTYIERERESDEEFTLCYSGFQEGSTQTNHSKVVNRSTIGTTIHSGCSFCLCLCVSLTPFLLNQRRFIL